MVFKENPYQTGFRKSLARYTALVGGWGSGKTASGILTMVGECTASPDSLWLCGRKEFRDLKDSTMRDYRLYTGLHINSDNDCVFPNGSVIMFRHAEQLNNLGNINLSGFYLEQAEEFDTANEFWMLDGRLRRSRLQYDRLFNECQHRWEYGTVNTGNGTGVNVKCSLCGLDGLDLIKRRRGLIIANSRGHNWIYQLFKVNPNASDLFELFEATMYDNAHNLPADYIKSKEELKRTEPKIYNRFVMNSYEESDVESIVIPESLIMESMTVVMIYTDDRIHIAVDPAGSGGDRCVMYVFRGTKPIEKKVLQSVLDKKVTVGHINQLKYKHKASQVEGDDIGIGWEMFNELDNQGVTTVRMTQSRASSNPMRFENLRAEKWWYLREQLIARNIDGSYFKNDNDLVTQLTAVRYEPNSKGVIRLEPKSETKKRLGRSPDDADAYVDGIFATRTMPHKVVPSKGRTAREMRSPVGSGYMAS